MNLKERLSHKLKVKQRHLLRTSRLYSHSCSISIDYSHIRKEKRQHLAEDWVPTAEEQSLVHNLYREYLAWKRAGMEGGEYVLISDTAMTNVELMQPQVRVLSVSF